MPEKKIYPSLDGLRTIACIGIVMMHMLAKENNSYDISGFLFQRVIPSFTDFVFLFMMVSAFGLCCGYHSRILQGTVNLPDFYRKRYQKILPFFTFLVLIDLACGFSKAAVYESIADISLTFGLFPNQISVIGVGWFLGLIFAFYMLFPFFCVLVKNLRSTWLCFAAALVMNYIGGAYFGIGRNNIVFSSCYFFAGALLFHYRSRLELLRWYLSLPVLALCTALYYLAGSCTATCMLLAAAWLIFSISEAGRILCGRAFHWVSSISLEIYLSHMAVFRAAQKLHLNTCFGNGALQYFFTTLVVLGGAMLFSFAASRCLEKGIAFLKVRAKY